MDLISELRLINEHTLEVEGVRYACRIGRGGIAGPGQKREGDLKTPTGRFPLRACFYRPDRIYPPPVTALPRIALTPDDGWCDAPLYPLYNQKIKLPFSESHEQLWRADGVYDLIVPLGYNDASPVPGLGSAIFLHIMRPDGVGTEGCVAVTREALLALLPRLGVETILVVE